MRYLLSTCCFLFATQLAHSNTVALNDTLQGTEEMTLSGNVYTNDTLTDGTYTFSLTGTVANGLMNWMSDGTFNFTPEANFFGNIVFEYEVCSDLSVCDTAQVLMQIVNVNDAPVVLYEAFSTNEEVMLTGNVSLNDIDPDGQTLHYELLDAPQNGGITFQSDGAFTFSPSWNFFGETIFNYWCCDATIEGECTAGQVVITVLPVNDVPTTYTPAVNICQGTLYEGDLTSSNTDVEGQPVSLMYATCADGTVTFQSIGTFQFLPDADFAGTAQINYQLCDNNVPAGCITGFKEMYVRSNMLSLSNVVVEEESCQHIQDGQFNAQLAGGLGPFVFSWDNISSNATSQRFIYRNNQQSGSHTLQVTDMSTCASDTLFAINIPLNSDTYLLLSSETSAINCYQQIATVQLEASGGFGNSYTLQWLNGLVGNSQTEINAGVYDILVSDNVGCSDTLQIEVVVDPCSFDALIIPEGFSPDGDGKNDLFAMPGIEFFPDNELTIYNEWGTQVFDWLGYTGRWNGYDRPSGKLLPTGTYYYVLKVKNEEVRKGYVVIEY